jgi:hypothetical protein
MTNIVVSLKGLNTIKEVAKGGQQQLVLMAHKSRNFFDPGKE